MLHDHTFVIPPPVQVISPDWDYHGDISRISNSGVKEILKSPAHYAQKYLIADSKPKTTQALIFGQMLHCLVYEPIEFPKRFLFMPKISQRSSSGKDAVLEAERLAQSQGKKLAFREEYDLARRMADVIRKHPFMVEAMSDGEGERTILFTEPLTGAPCKIRLDWWSKSTGLIVDLKTCEDASAAGFRRACRTYKYYIQDPFYVDGCQASGELYPEGFVFFAIEKTPPFACKPYFLSDADRQFGRSEYQRGLTTYMACRDVNYWPSYGAAPEELSLYLNR